MRMDFSSNKFQAENLSLADNFLSLPPGLQIFLFFTYNFSMCSPKTNIIVTIKKSEKTVESNCLANQVRKRRPPSCFAVAAWTSNFILYFYNALASLKIELM